MSRDNEEKDRLLLEVGCKLACAIEGLTEYLKHNHNPAILNRLAEMERRLTDAIADSAAIAPSTERAARRLGSALDKLDATIPDKES